MRRAAARRPGAGLNRRPGYRGGVSAGTAASSPPTIEISGTVLIGETLTATHDGDSVQWLRDGSPISGATSSTYEVTSDDIGPSITCEATNDAGSTVSNTLTYAHATHLPETAIGVSTMGITSADSGTTVQSWASSLGGISCTLSASASSNRPALSGGGTGGRPLVTFDGSDDVLHGTFTKGSALTTRRAGIVGSRVSYLTSGRIWLGYSVGNSFVFGLRCAAATAYQCVESGVVTSTSTIDPDGVWLHAWGANDGSIQTLGAGDSILDTDAGVPTTRADGNEVVLGGSSLATNCANIAIQAWHFGPDLNDDQFTHLRALLTYHTGITS